MPRLVAMGTPPPDLPSSPPSQVVGQQTHPSTVVPMGGGQGPGSTMVAGRRINTLAVVCLVTSLVAPFALSAESESFATDDVRRSIEKFTKG